MPIPEERLSTTVVEGTILPPMNRRRPALTSYHIGGIDISDASEGLEVQTWVAQGFTNRIDVYPEGEPGAAETIVSGATKIEFVSLAFDQNMRPVIAYTDDGDHKLYWFDSTIPDYTTTDFPGISSPYVVTDDTRAVSVTTGNSDVLFFYLDGGLQYRQQRDRYGTEYTLEANATGRIARAGITDKLRIQIEFE